MQQAAKVLGSTLEHLGQLLDALSEIQRGRPRRFPDRVPAEQLRGQRAALPVLPMFRLVVVQEVGGRSPAGAADLEIVVEVETLRPREMDQQRMQVYRHAIAENVGMA